MRVPGLASATDAGKNIFEGFESGYHFVPFNMSHHFGSVGGFLSTGVGMAALGGGIGATVGAGAAAMSSMDPGMGAIVGGSIGAASGLMALPLAGLGFRAAEGITTGAMNAGSNILHALAGGEAAEDVGLIGAAIPPLVAGTLREASRIGGGVFDAVGSLFRWKDTSKTGGAALTADETIEDIGKVKLTNPFTGWVDIGRNLRSNIGAVDKAASSAEKARGFTKAGLSVLKDTGKAIGKTLWNGDTVILGASVMQGAVDAWQQYNKIHMGQIDPMTRRPTPGVPYLDNAGATGDLVFAMNANRNG